MQLDIFSQRPSAASRYEQLVQEREPYLRRARRAAELTIPSLIPPENASAQTDFVDPFQSVGARGVNNLSARLALALLPPGTPFFRLELDAVAQREMQAKGGAESQDDTRGKFEEVFALIEQSVMNRMEQAGVRSSATEGLKHLIVSGNVLLQVLETGGVRMFPLSHYVAKRSKNDELLEVIVKEVVAKAALPPEVLAMVEATKSGNSDNASDSEVDVYTRIWLQEGRYHEHQEVEGAIVAGSEGQYPLDKNPWLPLRFNKIDGADYGRGHVEEHISDLASLDALQQALVEGAAQAARVLWTVRPGSMTDAEEVSESANGSVIEAEAEDIKAVQLQKNADFSVADKVSERIERRLEQAFLLYSSIQRQAERVTAEEIRQMAAELEQTLGGVYAVLALELQKPLAVQVMFQLEREKKIPALGKGKDAIEPKIVAGLQGLGRNNDLSRLDAYVQGLSELFGPAAVEKWINMEAYLRRRGAALALETKGLVRTAQEVEAKEQAMQQQQMQAQLAPQAMDAMMAQQQGAPNGTA